MVVFVVLDVKVFMVVRYVDLALLFLLSLFLLVFLLLGDQLHSDLTLNRLQNMPPPSITILLSPTSDLGIFYDLLQLHFLSYIVDFFLKFLILHQMDFRLLFEHLDFLLINLKFAHFDVTVVARMPQDGILLCIRFFMATLQEVVFEQLGIQLCVLETFEVTDLEFVGVRIIAARTCFFARRNRRAVIICKRFELLTTTLFRRFRQFFKRYPLFNSTYRDRRRFSTIIYGVVRFELLSNIKHRSQRFLDGSSVPSLHGPLQRELIRRLDPLKHRPLPLLLLLRILLLMFLQLLLKLLEVAISAEANGLARRRLHDRILFHEHKLVISRLISLLARV